MAVAYWQVLACLILAAAPWLLPDSALLSPSIQPSFPCLPKFCLAIGPKQFLYSLMVITAHRGDSYINKRMRKIQYTKIDRKEVPSKRLITEPC